VPQLALLKIQRPMEIPVEVQGRGQAPAQARLEQRERLSPREDPPGLVLLAQPVRARLALQDRAVRVHLGQLGQQVLVPLERAAALVRAPPVQERPEVVLLVPVDQQVPVVRQVPVAQQGQEEQPAQVVQLVLRERLVLRARVVQLVQPELVVQLAPLALVAAQRCVRMVVLSMQIATHVRLLSFKWGVAPKRQLLVETTPNALRSTIVLEPATMTLVHKLAVPAIPTVWTISTP
jgi:hypothetical protein